MLSPGDRVKDYEVIAPLRSGGMAVLYLARRRGVGGFSRLVALKLVHPHLVEDETIHQLFLNEARISAAVAHPSVVNVEEIGQTGDSYFIAMEYVHGVSLSELLTSLRERRLRMSQKLCVWLIAQVAEALHAVHEATGENGLPLNIVHRDVSPQNVLIGHTGHIKLIDFGIAKSQPANQQGASGLAVLGKLGYMAPEQLRGDPADRRSDVYALGVMLWEMLTSRSLFRCQGLDDERDWAMRERPAPPSKYASISSTALDEVVLRALAHDPKERFQSAFEFRTALLRADASAVLVDAPTFAALMREMLGHELERKRKQLPSDVSMQLNLDAELTTSRSIRFDELTSELEIPEERRGDDESGPRATGARHAAPDSGESEVEDDRPTIASSPPALRGERASPAAGIAISREVFDPPSTVIYQQSEAEVVTELGGPDTAAYLLAARPPRRVHLTHATWIGAVCLGVGMALGAAVSGSDVRLPVEVEQPSAAELRFGAASMPGHVNTLDRHPDGEQRQEPMARQVEDDSRSERETRRRAAREERRALRRLAAAESGSRRTSESRDAGTRSTKSSSTSTRKSRHR